MALPFLLFRFTSITHYFPPPTISPIAQDRTATGIGVHSDYIPIFRKIFRWQFGSRTTEQWNRVDYLNPWQLNAVSMDKCGSKAR
jgi:hypothetical protein